MRIIGFNLPVSLNTRTYQSNICIYKNAVGKKIYCNYYSPRCDVEENIWA